MADNFLTFSEVLPRLPEEEEAWLNLQLEVVYVVGDKEYAETELPEGLYPEDADWHGRRAYRDMEGYDPDFDDEVGFGFEFEGRRGEGEQGRQMWAYAEERGSVEHLAHLVHMFLKTFRPDECWSLTYSTTCSKLRIGEFGGGAVFVTADSIRWENAYDFTAQEQAVFEARKPLAPGTGTRPIEMYVGTFRGDAQMWYTTDVEIPLNTPVDVIERVAKAVLKRELAARGEQAAFCGVYNTRDDEASEA